MLYLRESFKEEKDFEGKNNPSLSEEGVQVGKRIKLKISGIKFDKCYSSFLLKDFSSAIILVGDRLVVERTHSFDKIDKEEIMAFVTDLDLDKNILIVASKEIILIIKEKFEANVYEI